jgi:hypothetical protein
LGKGYALTSDDFEMMGTGTLANGAEARMDASEGSLAVAGDYHSGPLSTVIPFGIWGVITFLWFTFAGLRVTYRNLKYGDPQLRIVNIYFLAQNITHFISFLFIFGSYSDDIYGFARIIGFSIALNGGILGPHSSSKPAVSKSAVPPQLNKPWSRAQPQPV